MKKFSTVLSAAVLAGTVILSATACSSPAQSEEQPEKATSASATPTATPVVKSTPAPTTSSAPVKATAAATPTEVTSPVKKEGPLATPAPVKTVTPSVPVKTKPASPVKTAPVVSAPVQTDADRIAATLTGYYDVVSAPKNLAKIKQAGGGKFNGPPVSDADLAKTVSGFPEGFKYFDVSSSQNITNAYYQLFANATQSSRTPGAKAVKVPAKAITINGSKATVKASMLTFADGKPVTGAPYFTFDPIKLVKAKNGSWVMIPEPPRHALL